MKRTTLILDEDSFSRAKQLAAAEGVTLSEIVDELLRLGLAARRPRRPRKCLELPSFSMGLPTVNLADREQLAEAMGGR